MQQVRFVVLLILAVLTALMGYRHQGIGHLFVEPEILTLTQAAQRASLIIVGTVRTVGTTRMMVTDDGWEKEAPFWSNRGLPYTNFRVEIEQVIKAPYDFTAKTVLFRVLGTKATLHNIDETHLSDLEDGYRYILFLTGPTGPYDTVAWRPVDNLHIFPVREGFVYPVRRAFLWQVDTLRVPVSLDTFKVQVERLMAPSP